MDIIEIVRDPANSPAGMVFGRLYLNGQPLLYTLEPDIMMRIRPGTYSAQIYQSPRNGRVLLLDVPGRTFIEIHAGNSVKDTTGCILVGTSRHGKEVWHSRSAMRQLLESLGSRSDIKVIVK